MHGYGIAIRIEQVSKGVFHINAGSLFIAIQRMLRAGLIRGEWKATENSRRVKYYVLTEQGRKEAQQRNARMGKASGGHSQNLGGVVGRFHVITAKYGGRDTIAVPKETRRSGVGPGAA